MKRASRLVQDILTDPWFIVASAASTVAAFVAFVHGATTQKPNQLSDFLLAAGLVLLIVGYIYSIQVRSENNFLRSSYTTLYEINAIYRDKLYSLFHPEASNEDGAVALIEEERALRAVCQRIQSVFERITLRRCVVTVKLLTKDESGASVARTYVRSEELSIRDRAGEASYEVGSGLNIGFDTAILSRPDGQLSHFFSGDLERDASFGNYSNQRKDFLRYYRSTLVVPIWSSEISALASGGESAFDSTVDLVGFLSVDTLSKNRLNNGYHLMFLSALASQMYNFISLMRGRYRTANNISQPEGGAQQ